MHNRPAMGRAGSVPIESGVLLGLPALAAALLLGVVAMQAAALAAAALGLRTALVASEMALAAPGLLALRLSGASLGLAGAPRLRARIALLSLATGASVWVGSLGLIQVQSFLWPPAAAYLEAFQRLHAALRPSDPASAVASVVAIALVPAVCEEIVFRGITLPALVPRFGGTPAVLVSALLFGLAHGDLYRLPFATAVGIALGFLRRRTGSLPPAILAHATVNTGTFVIALLAQPTRPATAPEAHPILGSALLLAGCAATIVLLGVPVDSSKTDT